MTQMVMREALDGYEGFRVGGRNINNLRYANDIVLFATLSTELHELVNRVDRVTRS